MIIFGVAVGVLAIVGFGIVIARKVDGDSTNFLVAGRGLALPLVAVTLMGQAVDSNATVGNTDLASGFGFWAGASLPLGLALCLVLTGLFFAKPMNRMGLLTLADFYRRRYGRAIEVAASVLMIVSFCILLAGNMVACGLLLEHFLGIDYAWGVVIAVGLVLSYTIAGGLFSDAYTAAAQMVITVTAAVALFGWMALAHGITVPEGMGPFDLGQLTDAEQGATINWATLVALGIGDIVAIDFMQRIFAAKSPSVARRACFVGAAGTAVVGVLFSLVALSAAPVLGDTVDGPVLYALLGGHAPVAITVLVLSGIVAASFSTAAGAILGTAAVAARNIVGVRQIAGPDGKDLLLRATRIGMLPICAIAVYFALRVPETGILLTLAFDLMLCGLAVPMILGLFWQRGGSAAAAAALTAGSGVRLVLFVLTPTIYGAENTLMYWDNSWIGASFDGWPTFLGAAVSLLAYVTVALVWRTRTADLDRPVEQAPELVAAPR